MSERLGRHERLLAVIGPSGSGKSTLVQALAAAGRLEVTPSWTTRPPRGDELEGCVEHRFVSDDEFDELEGRGFFVETVRMFGLPYRYGLPPVDRARTGAVSGIMVRVGLLPLLRRHHARPIVYQIEDDRPRVAARLRRRHLNTQALGSRLRDYEAERDQGRAAADRVFFNRDQIVDLVREVESALETDFILR